MGDDFYLGQPVVERLPKLLKRIAAGEFRIPRFQRPFVWQDKQRLLLLDSIRKGIPIGSVLVWRPSTRPGLMEYSRLGPFRLPKIPDTGGRSYVIDGHQRLVTLFSAFSEPVDVELSGAVTAAETASNDEEGDEQDVRWPIYYDLAKEEFKLAPKRRRISVEWLPLPRLIEPRQLYEHQKRLLAKNLGVLSDRAERLAEVVKDYSLPIVPILSDALGTVTECFRRVNSTGTPMDEVHMLNALMWTDEIDLRGQLQKVIEQLVPLGWGGISEQLLLDVIKIALDLDYFYAEPDDLHRELKKAPEILLSLRDNLASAIRFLEERCCLRGPKMVPSTLQVVLLAEATRVHRAALSGRVADELWVWFWRTTFTEAFTGCSNRDIHDQVEVVRRLARGQLHDWSKEEPTAVTPVSRFRPNGVRSRGIALLLSHHASASAGSAEVDAAGLLAKLGREALPKILPIADGALGGRAAGPENRWIVDPRALTELRGLLASGPRADRSNVLARHLLPEEAIAAYDRGDHAEFLALRRRALIQMERELAERVGLEYVED